MSKLMGQPHQIIQGANEDGTPTGDYFPKEEGHTGSGRRHFAITVLVYNDKDELLIQRRKHAVFNDIWDMTASTHQLHKEDGTNETDEEATLRSLKREYGIEKVQDLKTWGAINYFAQYEGFCENEHDVILTAKFDGEIHLNDEVGYNYKWMDKMEFLKDIEKNPQDYAPWSVEGAKLLKKKDFFA